MSGLTQNCRGLSLRRSCSYLCWSIGINAMLNPSIFTHTHSKSWLPYLCIFPPSISFPVVWFPQSGGGFDNLMRRIAFFWWPEPSSTKAASCGDKNMMTTVMTMTTMMMVVVVMIAIDWPLWLVIGHDNHEDDDDGGIDYGWGQWRKCLRLLSRLSLVLPLD